MISLEILEKAFAKSLLTNCTFPVNSYNGEDGDSMFLKKACLTD